ncbi:MAG: chloride channel protein [Clostridia bacterium]|nr:chloride channel protein [Clostridia bacterium]
MNTKVKNKGSVYFNAVQLIVVGSITGLFAGLTVTLYNLCASFLEGTAKDIYSFIRQNPGFIPLLILTLLLGSFLLSVAIRLVPMIKGSGIPQTEGATRGIIRFKWYRDAVTMFAVSLLSIFMGLSAGAEGPSVHIGATVGDGVSSVTRRNEMIRRYQITGGACAGLAIAIGAPMSGMAFAFEEAHKRFTPEVFICAFSSVIVGMLTKTALYLMLGLNMHGGFSAFLLSEIQLWEYGFVALSSIICGLLGVLLFKSVFWVRKLLKRISLKRRWQTDWLKMSIAVLIGGLFSLITVNLMGGGHAFIESLGSLANEQTPTVLGIPIVYTLAIVLVMKAFITVLNMGASVPCGTFIPMLAIGACIGALTSEIWVNWGMSEASKDTIIMICMAAFFATVVKAPITAVIMVVEMTHSFTPLLPVIIGVSIGYFIGDIARTDSIYETLLEQIVEESDQKVKKESVKFTFTAKPLSIAIGREIRDVLWPNNARVTKILRGEETVFPSADTVILEGDVLTFSCFTDNAKIVEDDLKNILGNL